MEHMMEQKVNVKFCVQPQKLLRDVKTVYGECAMSRSKVLRCTKVSEKAEKMAYSSELAVTGY
jgi:hypothetical protein